MGQQQFGIGAVYHGPRLPQLRIDAAMTGEQRGVFGIHLNGKEFLVGFKPPSLLPGQWLSSLPAIMIEKNY
ncbi:MAG: hypothetical protein QM599_01175 [Pseudoxanthomonas sp.]